MADQSLTDSLAPAGIRLVADGALRRRADGRVLIGGSPLRIVRLSERGASVVDSWLDGTPVADVRAARALARRLLDAGLLHPIVSPTAALDITIVIPVRDDASGLDCCLAALDSVTELSPGEQAPPVVVVDDGSSDAEAIAAVVTRHGALLVRREASGGPGVARMTGLENVDSSLIAFIDADVEAWPGWLDHLVAHFDDETVVAVAPRVRSRPGPGLRDRYEMAHGPLDLGGTVANVGPRRAVAYVPSAALVVRREALDEINGFDPDLRYGEDVDLIWRLVEAGGVVRYDPDVEVNHAPRPSWFAWLRQRRAYGSSAAALGRRHGRNVAPARCSRWSAAAWGAAAAGHPFIGLGMAAGSTAALTKKLKNLPDPLAEALRLGLLGHLHAGRGLARALARVWWPIAAVAATVSPRTRPVITAAVVVPHLVDWMAGSRPADPFRSVGLAIIDDMAYGVGVWDGVVRHGDVTALLPDFVDWPGRRSVVEADTVAEP